MLKHKQTIWFILACLSAAGIFFFDLYSITFRDIQTQQIRIADISIRHSNTIRITHTCLLIVTPLVAILFFRKHIIQYVLASITILFNCFFMLSTYFIFDIRTFLIKSLIIESHYEIGFYLPALSSLFLVIAIITIIIERKKKQAIK